MSDPADKSDDLIAELAKLMAASPSGNQPAATPVAKAPPLSTTPPPVRIPGMDQFRPAMPVQPSAPVQPAAPAQPAAHVPPPASITPSPPPVAPPVTSRGPVTGAIRIPGMDAPAPVATSAPVSKFDFGSKPAVTPIRQEPLSTLAERLAPQNPANRAEPSLASGPNPPPIPIRIPSDLKPVSENRSFAQGPALTVTSHPTPTPAAPPPSPAGDISFDFGFAAKPPAAPAALAPKPADTAEPHDPIADLIAAELADEDVSESAPPRQEFRPAPAAPIARTVVTPQPAPPKPVVSPVAPAASRQASTQPIPLKPVSVAPRAPEADRFAVSPGIGLNMKPPAGQPLAPPVQRAPEPKPEPVDSDPMAEIESLIGEAVRVELAPPGPVRVQSVQPITPHVQLDNDDDDSDDDRDDDEHEHDDDEAPRRADTVHAPVVPPLNSQFAPRRSGLNDESGPSSAEDAILAAAAATGAEVDRIEPPTGDESPYRRLKVKPARSSWVSGGIRQYVGMAVAGTLLLAAGLGLYWVLNMGRGNTIATANDAPQLTADATPVKEVPEVQPDAQAETPRSPVLEQMDGTSIAPTEEQLVSTDETGGGNVPRDVTQVAAADTEGGLANRKVRTVTVRPDGTIVSGDDAVAGAETLPVARPNVPEVPSISAETPSLLGDPAEAAATETATTSAPLSLDTSVAPVEATTALSAGADVPTVFDANVRAPSPLPVPGRDTPVQRSETTTAIAQEPAAINLTGAQTPNGQIDLLGGQIEPVQVAAAPPAAVDAGSAAAYVQLSSSPSQADAENSRRSLTNRYGSLFGGSSLVIQPADLGQKGTWYRVKLPASSLADAQSKCASIKANGGDCIVSGS